MGLWISGTATAFAMAALFLYAWTTYNAVIRLRVHVDESWSGVTVQLKRRADLIPNLAEAVKGYAAHEKTLLENLAQARSVMLSARDPAEASVAEGFLQGILKSLSVVAESYPQLKASQNYLQLQDALTDTEDKIQAARRFYNGSVRELNAKIKVFPNNAVAAMFKLDSGTFFDTEDAPSLSVPPRIEF